MMRAYQSTLYQKAQPGMAIASDPNASPDALAEIVRRFFAGSGMIFDWTHIQYYYALREVARHQNTPLDALLEAGLVFPYEVSLNPTLELSILAEQPDIAPDSPLFRLVPTGNLSSALVNLLESVWSKGYSPLWATLALAQNPDASPAFIQQALKDNRNVPVVQEALSHHRNRPGHDAYPLPYTRAEALKAVRTTHTSYYDSLAFFARDRLISLEVIAEYEALRPAASDWTQKYTGAVVRAFHPDTPSHEREQAQQELRTRRVKIGPERWKLPALPGEAIAHMVALHMDATQPLLALTGGQPDDVTKAILKHHHPAVRAALAHGPALPQWALSELLQDPHARVRATARQAESA